MRLILLAFMALVMMGGGGAGAYLYFMKPAEASIGAGQDHMRAGETTQKQAAAPGVFVTLDPLILPVIDRRGVTQTLSLVVVVEVPDDAAKAHAEHLAPRLKDAFIQDMYGYLSRQEVMPKGVLDVTMIKQRLNEVSAKVLGNDKVNDVLFQVVQQRPL